MEYIANNTKEELENKIVHQQALIDELVGALKEVMRVPHDVEDEYNAIKLITKAEKEAK